MQFVGDHERCSCRQWAACGLEMTACPKKHNMIIFSCGWLGAATQKLTTAIKKHIFVLL